MSDTLPLTETPILLSTTRTKKAISLTALIDVVFILLMFFMLTSTFIKWHKFELQTATAGNQVAVPQSKADSQLIIIRENEQFSLVTTALVNNKHEQTFSSLAQLIETLDTKVATVLLPEANIEVQQIMASMVQLKNANITQVTLGNVLPKQGKH